MTKLEKKQKAAVATKKVPKKKSARVLKAAVLARVLRDTKASLARLDGIEGRLRLAINDIGSNAAKEARERGALGLRITALERRADRVDSLLTANANTYLANREVDSKRMDEIERRIDCVPVIKETADEPETRRVSIVTVMGWWMQALKINSQDPNVMRHFLKNFGIEVY